MTGLVSSPVNGEPSDCEESTPLLPSVPSNQNGDDSPSSSASYFMSSLTTRQKWKSAWKIWRIPIMCYTFALLIEFGDFIRSTPRTRLLESIICNRYYAEEALNNGSGVGSPNGSHNYRLPIPEEQCKVPIVQAELVTLKAYLKIGENLLSLTFAIPFGYLANKTSRNFVLTLGVCAQIISELWTLFVCYFTPTVPFSLIYLTMFLKSTGGGQSVLTAMVYAILSDSVAAETRARAFLYLASAPLVIEMVAPMLGSVLMERWSVYIPLIVGFPFELFSLVMLRVIPITVKQGKQTLEERPLLNDSSSTEADTENDNHDESEGANRKLKIIILRILAPLIITWTLICRSRNLLLVNLSFLVTTLGRETLDFLVQYCSKRFGWKLAKANYLISFRAFVSLGLFLVILPIISRFFRKSRGMSPSKSDLWIARVSSIFGIIGPVMIGLSPSAELMIVALSLFTLSFGFRAAFQSYATSLVKPEEVALLYSALACMSIIGALIASPLIAATFRLGLSIGGLGIGLPFFVAAGFFTVSAIGAWGSRVEEDANN